MEMASGWQDWICMTTIINKVIYSVSTEIFWNKFPCARFHFHYGWASQSVVGIYI